MLSARLLARSLVAAVRPVSLAGSRSTTARLIRPTFAATATAPSRILNRSFYIQEQSKYPLEDGVYPLFTPNSLYHHFTIRHAKHIRRFNDLVERTPYDTQELIDVLMETSHFPEAAPIFNQAAEIYNHDFFFKCITPNGTALTNTQIIEMFEAQFGGIDKFKKQFSAFAKATFGSGWTWLVSYQGEWSVMNTINAGTPVAAGLTPLLALDMWEHSYYLDYQDNVQGYIDNFFKSVDWEAFVERALPHTNSFLKPQLE